ncbi:MAG: 30S ribosomal protein S12 methylthiotransferase RimO [Lachnospiraceae bacterium]|nr:30S ribosomal protein S12 methylthiotransferase RimO [Lachnospiraceae bacterium]
MDIYFVSLGCDKNLVDSEMMIKNLRNAGHRIIDDEALADVIVINTCCFIGDAKEESIQAILDMAQYKESGNCKLLVAAGCLAQRYHEEIKTELPEVDVIIGTMGYEALVEAIEDGLERQGHSEDGSVRDSHPEYLKDIDYLPEPVLDRDSMTGGYYAYLKIAEGCDKHCTYCVIPRVRGKYRSVPMEKLLTQAEHLVENGAREIILVAQETTLYGADLYGEKSLPLLLEKLSGIEELRWIRILYCYPEEITTELIDAIERLPKVCNYLDIPIQHGADTILKRMGRRTNQREIIQMVEELRRRIPDIALRTTLITGFPGETEEEFLELKRFVKRMKFDRLGVFAYSKEEDTPAGEMDGQIPEEEKEKRRDEIMELQQSIAFEKSREQTGRVLEVMIEGYMAEDEVDAARTYMDAPDVDGYIFIESDWNLMSGDFVKVRVISAEGYDLLGEIVDDYTC